MQPDSWLDRFFDSYYRLRPVNATFIGVHDYDDVLPDYSGDGVAEAISDMRTLLNDLDRVDRANATRSQQIDLRLAEGYLRVQLWEFGSNHFQNGNPSHHVGEAVFGPMSLFLRESTPLADRMNSARGRFEQVPRLLDQARQVVERAPRRWIERAIDECSGGLEFAGKGVELYLAAHSIEDDRLVDSALRAAAAFEAYQRHLKDVMLPQSLDEGYGCGEDALDQCIRLGHALDMTPQQIADYGRGVMEDSIVRLERAARDLGYSGWQEALKVLDDDHPEPEHYVATYDEVWKAARDHAIEHDLVTWPDFPIRYVERPHWARSAAPHLYFLFYRAPPAFDPVDVYEYLVAPLPEDHPEQVLRVNNHAAIKMNHVVHHGGLGHHVQNWHAYRAESRVGQIAAVDCASRIAMLCGGTMAEGWSCYATDLMDEFGFCTPLEHLSQIHGRVRMAGRAIVDVELHRNTMSLDEAAAFYRDQTGMSQAAAMSEAVKNSMNPGAALMYLIGTDAIHRLRSELVSPAGGLSMREFHDSFLSFGSIPVTMISEEMRAAHKPGA